MSLKKLTKVFSETFYVTVIIFAFLTEISENSKINI